MTFLLFKVSDHVALNQIRADRKMSCISEKLVWRSTYTLSVYVIYVIIIKNVLVCPKRQ